MSARRGDPPGISRSCDGDSRYRSENAWSYPHFGNTTFGRRHIAAPRPLPGVRCRTTRIPTSSRGSTDKPRTIRPGHPLRSGLQRPVSRTYRPQRDTATRPLEGCCSSLLPRPAPAGFRTDWSGVRTHSYYLFNSTLLGHIYRDIEHKAERFSAIYIESTYSKSLIMVPPRHLLMPSCKCKTPARDRSIKRWWPIQSP